MEKIIRFYDIYWESYVNLKFEEVAKIYTHEHYLEIITVDGFHFTSYEVLFVNNLWED